MLTLLRAYKTELNPTIEQAQKIRKTIGVCRFIYNLFLGTNQQRYQNGLKHMSGYDFSKFLNHEYLKAYPEQSWIKEVSSKAVKKSIMDADSAYKRFFKGKANFPKFKKKGKSDPSMYFVNAGVHIERHRIKIPTIGWVRLKEFGYIPEKFKIISGCVITKNNRYYVSVLLDVPELAKPNLNPNGIGIDVGVKDLAITSDGRVYANINKSKRIKKLQRRLKRQQRRLSRKYKSLKKSKSKKGKATHKNIQKQCLKVARLYERIMNIRVDYENKVISELVKAKPAYIALEDLNVSGMMKNRYLSKAISEQRLRFFRNKLETKAAEYGIEIREVNRWYPSSKICHNCGYLKSNLALKERIYDCPCCNYHADRDYNAALNIRDTNEYKLV